MDRVEDSSWAAEWSDTAVVHNHPELHHYTTADALEGMISTNSFWATHFRHLNDSTEVLGIAERIGPAWETSFENILRKRRTISKVNRAIIAYGGLRSASHILAESLYNVFANATFGTAQSPPSQTVSGAPFILSFCTHTSEPYEAQNGLLSQWRGYGGGEGVCLVFDTEGLFKNLDNEYRRYAYTHAGFHDVLYDRDDLRLDDEFPELFEAADTYVQIKLGLRVRSPGANAISQFILAATRFKHRAFSEEREVRIVVCPVDSRFFTQSTTSQKARLPAKPSFVTNGKERIALFQEQAQPLPLRRIIVGPSNDTGKVARRVRDLTHGKVEVTISQTPFVAG